MKSVSTLLLTLTLLFATIIPSFASSTGPLPKLAAEIKSAIKDFNTIPAERKVQIKKIADYICAKLKSEKKVSLTYICVHNSDRSFLGQLWAMAAADYYQVKGISAYSGGLIITAFNPIVIQTLNNAGFQITKTFDTSNPRYEARYSTQAAPVLCFSKKYMDTPNPKTNFGAITTCSEADEACPLVQGADIRISTPYKAVKFSDGKPEQTAVYNACSRQMEVEILYCFSLVKAAGN